MVGAPATEAREREPGASRGETVDQPTNQQRPVGGQRVGAEAQLWPPTGQEAGEKLPLLLVRPVREPSALCIGPRLWGDDPPNLSILISGGKETNRDSPSKGD